MKKVLIVEADKYARVKLSLLLKECECEIEWAETMPDAVKKMKEEYFDCMVLDVESRRAQGYEAIPIVRAISPDTEVIATTSENSRELERRTREQGVFYYYIKSFDPAELKTAVKNALKKHEKKSNANGLWKDRRKGEEQ